MTEPTNIQSRLVWTFNVAMFVAVGFFFLWLFVVEPIFTDYLKTKGFNPNKLPEALAVAYGLAVGVLPGMLISFGGLVFIYKRWLLPHRGRLAHEQLSRLVQARQALTNAVTQIESFEQELREKTTQAEQLEQQLASLRSLNSETAADLQMKLRAVELVNRHRIWFERIVSFLIGVVSSLVAAYVWQFVQPNADVSPQSNPPLERTR
jgi:hypothetical protein